MLLYWPLPEEHLEISCRTGSAGSLVLYNHNSHRIEGRILKILLMMNNTTLEDNCWLVWARLDSLVGATRTTWCDGIGQSRRLPILFKQQGEGVWDLHSPVAVMWDHKCISHRISFLLLHGQMFLGSHSFQSSSSQLGDKCQQHPVWMAIFSKMLLEHNSSLVPGIHRHFACRLPPCCNAEKQSVDFVLFPACLITIIHTHNNILLLTSMAEEEMVNQFLSECHGQHFQYNHYLFCAYQSYQAYRTAAVFYSISENKYLKNVQISARLKRAGTKSLTINFYVLFFFFPIKNLGVFVSCKQILRSF